jgi:hypothetical protein
MLFDQYGAPFRAKNDSITLSNDITDPKSGQIIVPRGTKIVQANGKAYISGAGGQDQPVSLSVSPQDVYFVQAQRNWLSGYKAADFRHNEGPQTVPTDRDTFKQWGFGIDHGFGIVNTRASEEGWPKELSTKPTLTDQQIEWHRLAFWMSRNVQDQAEMPYLQSQLTMLARVLLANRELAVWGPGFTDWTAGALVLAANYDTANKVTLGAGFQWGGASGAGANSDPIGDLQTAHEASLMPITEWWMNRKTCNAMQSNESYIARVRGMIGQDRWSEDAALGRTGGGNQDFPIPQLPGLVRVIDSKITNPDTGAQVYTFPDGVVIGLHKSGESAAPATGQEIATGYLYKRSAPGGAAGDINVRTQIIEGRGFGGSLWIVEMGFKCSHVAPKVGYRIGGILQ